jgi:hypothetical protein
MPTQIPLRRLHWQGASALTTEQEVLVSDRVRQFRSFRGELGLALVN